MLIYTTVGQPDSVIANPRSQSVSECTLTLLLSRRRGVRFFCRHSRAGGGGEAE